MTFIEEHGVVRYRRSGNPYPHRNCCDLCQVCRAIRFVFDHCHRHGWIRGELCESCNIRLGRPALLPDDSALRYLANCPGCRPALTGTCPAGCVRGSLWSGYLRRFISCPACASGYAPWRGDGK